MLAGFYPAFDGPMVLFQDIIEVLHRAMLAIVHQRTLGFELRDRRRITGVPVGDVLQLCSRAEGWGQKIGNLARSPRKDRE